MVNLLENKQIIHIATDIVVLIGITFYFSSKNKKLLEHLEDLSQSLKDQEDMNKKNEEIIITEYDEDKIKDKTIDIFDKIAKNEVHYTAIIVISPKKNKKSVECAVLNNSSALSYMYKILITSVSDTSLLIMPIKFS